MGELLKLFFVYGSEKTSQKSAEIYSQGESSDSPGSFRYRNTGEINFRTLPRNFKKLKTQM